MIQTTIGIDISKDHLDTHRLADGTTRQFANCKAGHKALIKWLADTPLARIVYEPTGRYHGQLESRLGEAGLPLVKVNPRRARRFAEAIGKLAKTDRADAATLAQMGEALKLQPQPATDKTLAKLKELQTARAALIKDRTAARNRQKNLAALLLKQQCKARLEQIHKDLAEIDQAIDDIITADPECTKRRDILVSIPGIAKLTAHAMLIHMPELGTLNQKQAASLAGLAPVTRQSGAWRGKAYIQGGRAILRQTLYMPALVATRFNPDLKAKYQQLIKAGKPPKLAITAIMRKLIITANALIRANRNWKLKTLE
ncbi:IS110 family transposase [Denitrobaculum tricleocarpae]|uniref:IS110 family transposase n=1 Tax=Denitrobaculum tricleocarpae TaxID=2591009 RepID=A0A545T080_9PROT|nr:IS110 family transposase [Denitrobaculum tricleocarpae]TQV70628.1 IS110 family transposase [Denitrobaculum tricleocarpae]